MGGCLQLIGAGLGNNSLWKAMIVARSHVRSVIRTESPIVYPALSFLSSLACILLTLGEYWPFYRLLSRDWKNVAELKISKSRLGSYTVANASSLYDPSSFPLRR
jgi:hypothetical protein